MLHKREFTATQNRAHAIFVGSCHAQLLIGLVLYFISDAVNGALAGGIGVAMKNPALRFIAVEHIATMIIAIVLIQVGRSVSKKAVDAAAKHRKSLIFFSIGMLLILSRIPWNKAMWPL
jgi:hypothetical protein